MLQPCQSAKLAGGANVKEHAMSHKLNSAIAVVGIDIGKNSFHVVGHDRRGASSPGRLNGEVFCQAGRDQGRAREGRYLFRTNLSEHDPAKLRSCVQHSCGGCNKCSANEMQAPNELQCLQSSF